jgi:hypothetical protein
MREIAEFEVLEISIVKDPVQKYSVVFPGGDEDADPYDYTLVDYVIRGLGAPFDEWKTTWTTARHPHSLYSHVPPTDPCPCGSGRTYAECCLMEEGVMRPHVVVEFALPPPAELPRVVYPRASRAHAPGTASQNHATAPREES